MPNIGPRNSPITLLVKISFSEAPSSRRMWLVGILPAAAAFCLKSTCERQFKFNHTLYDNFSIGQMKTLKTLLCHTCGELVNL